MTTTKNKNKSDDYDPYHFNKLIDNALGSSSTTTNNEEEQEKQRKILKATERDLLKFMHNGEWQKISEFRYRMPSLRKFVDELERRYWSERDAVNSLWK